jgi:hypothetical protein
MRTALIASGGNVSREQLLKVLGRKDAMTDTPHEGLERTTP